MTNFNLFFYHVIFTKLLFTFTTFEKFFLFSTFIYKYDIFIKFYKIGRKYQTKNCNRIIALWYKVGWHVTRFPHISITVPYNIYTVYNILKPKSFKLYTTELLFCYSFLSGISNFRKILSFFYVYLQIWYFYKIL
jgi:hypothetical protein